MITGFPPFCRFLSQIKDLQHLFKSCQWCSLAGLDVDLRFVNLILKLAGLGGKCFLVEATCQIRVQKSLLHLLQIGQTTFERLGSLST
ncbi:MAG TPA: hypothetical protein DCM28_11580 [Phycisphaerales bacterium]|nr:hypothetical protein [Phycisphaerales bacterium]HCD34854.1 hypothetical protein [Phycisphaerales bacterium]